MSGDATRPQAVDALEAVYGPASDGGFGSATFWQPRAAGASFEDAAQAVYRAFVGAGWVRLGEAAWLGTWERVLSRSAGADDIVASLRAIEDRAVRRSVPMLLDEVESPEAAAAALRAAFQEQPLQELGVFRIGDGAAMAGLLLAGQPADADHLAAVAFLLD